MNYKIFCDESNHLLNDSSNIMVNGAILIDEDKVVETNKYIKLLRHKHNYHNEIKWTKLINKQKEFYKELIEYFFSSEFMKFKATLVVNKSDQKHEQYNRTHDDFYYVVYYYTLRNFLYRDNRYIYNLVTKDKYFNKPTYNTILSSLSDMKKHAIKNDVKKICMPMIGCGLDRLQWIRVKDIIHDVFKDSNINVIIYKL